MTSMSYRRMAILFAAVALVVTPALLQGAKPSSKYQPRPPLLVKAPQPKVGSPASDPNSQVIPDGDEPPSGGGGPTMTTQSWSVDWEIVEWGMTGHDGFTAVSQDGVLQSITVNSSQGGTRTITKAELDALGMPMPTPMTFAKASMQPASVQSAGFSQTINSIYGNTLTVRGTVHF